MSKSAKSKAEKMFSATGKQGDQALKEKEKGQRERAEHQSKLRELRLAKEAADRQAADEKPGAATETRKQAADQKPKSRLPQSRRPLS